MLVRLFRGPFLNVSLLILYFSTNNSIIITKREIRNFYCNFHLLPQFHRNKHLKISATFTATCWKSPREISNFRPQLSQKRPAKSWGDCLMLLWHSEIRANLRPPSNCLRSCGTFYQINYMSGRDDQSIKDKFTCLTPGYVCHDI